MKKYLILIFGIALTAACKPDTYTGPLESPEGNWEGIRTDYFFDGDMVGETETCEYTAISFYKQGLCCIENVKGAFPYTYDHDSGELTIDGRLWHVTTLTGAEMVMCCSVKALPVPEEGTEEEESPEAPTYEFEGFTIMSDVTGYYYMKGDTTVRCNYVETTDENGEPQIAFWYDSHTDHFIPLVVEVTK